MSSKKGHVRKEYNLPEDIVNKIEELAEESGVTNTEAVINAILFRYNADVMCRLPGRYPAKRCHAT